MTRIQRVLAFGLGVAALTVAGPASAGNMNGRAGTMPAYYDGQLFTINFKELRPAAEDAVLLHNNSINIIYMSDGCMPGGDMFVGVIDAIQGDGFNPLWQEVQIVFDRSLPCMQFTSDDDVIAAFEAGAIDLASTGEVYRCSVIGPKN